MPQRRLPVILGLGCTQTLAWASTVYIPAVLADPISRDLGLSPSMFFAAYSFALLISGVIAPRVGRTIDAVGGRGVLAISNIVIAAGLVLLAAATTPVMLWLAWLVLGVGMGLGLYDTAFAALGRIYGADARSAITGITLLGGFASTIGWPLSAWGAETIGWRATCFAWAIAHIVGGLPINCWLLPRAQPAPVEPGVAASGVTASGVTASGVAAPAARPRIAMTTTMWLLAFSMATAWMVTSAMATHLPRLLESAGATTVQAIAASALIGPAQVAARIVEATVLDRSHPLLSAKLANMAHPIGACLLALIGPGAVYVFALLHGCGNGIITIVRGTVPLALFGPENYGYRLGLLGAPSRIAQAASPLLFGFLIERMGTGALLVSAGLSLAALAALCAIPAAQRRESGSKPASG